MRRWSPIRVLLAILWFMGCSPPQIASDGSRDATTDASGDVRTDAPPGTCVDDRSCDDMVFCNGVERCAPGAPGADLRGCVRPTAPACLASQMCDEAGARCTTGCPDDDGDGHRLPSCGGDDCDDADGNRFPGNAEACDTNGHDEDCNPCTVTGTPSDGDLDNDRFPSATCSNPWLGSTPPVGCDLNLVRVDPATQTVGGVDCNDSAATGASIHPNVPEICGNLIDDNCNGAIDESIPGMVHVDRDNDGRGDPMTSMTVDLCAIPLGWVANTDDCDDSRNETYAGARELCDGRDNDCSLAGAMAGGIDIAEDRDRDMHSSLSAMCLGRGEPGAPGFVFPRDDCDDMLATVYTGATEVCGNGVDENCDRIVDNTTATVCDDLDGDGHGAGATRMVTSCPTIPAGTSTRCDDCDDAAATGARRFPGNRESCDRVDNDCSTPGTAVDSTEDADSDGYAPTAATCLRRGDLGANAMALPGGDCDDTNNTVRPMATEVCDRIDSNCSTGGGIALDEDRDNDAFAPAGAPCLGRGEVGAPPSAFPKTDCDDTHTTVNPGVTAAMDIASCDGFDNDCNLGTSELRRACATGGFCSSGGVCGEVLPVRRVEAGGGFACAIMGDGSVRCWGGNSVGQLGLGMTSATPAVIAARVPALVGVVDLSAGSQHVCASLSAGTLSCWGGNAQGQIGNGTTAVAPSPINIAGVSSVAGIATGDAHTCVRRGTDGAVWCWGNNFRGQLGLGTNISQNTPTAVPGLAGVLALAAGANHTCARMTDGSVRCWGMNNVGQLGLGNTTDRNVPTAVTGLTTVVEISARGDFTCARLADGTARCWGLNTWGNLGAGDTIVHTSPVAVSALTAVAQIDCGGQHTCARLVDGTLRCWGNNATGQLGLGSPGGTRTTPQVVPMLTALAEVSAGGGFTCVRTTAGSVRCFGDGTVGQLGNGALFGLSTPATTLGLSGPADSAGGDYFTCARLTDGLVRCFGQNSDGQLGDGTTGGTPRPVPAVASGLYDAAQISAGGSFACVRRANGSVSCWGANTQAQLGTGDTTPRNTPTLVPGLTPVAQVVTGSLHACARMMDGTVRCWGRNLEAQLGLGDTTLRMVPTVVPGLASVAELVAGALHTCARITDGTVRCWGRNSAGQLGLGDTTTRMSPTVVPGLTGVAALAAGNAHTCARLAAGTMRCWGGNSTGALGLGDLTNRTSPTAVPGLTTVAGIAAGGASTSVRLADGTLRCWGSNSSGALGLGDTTQRTSPIAVTGVAAVSAMAIGQGHQCVRAGTYGLLCSGDGSWGQLGSGATSSRTTFGAVPEP